MSVGGHDSVRGYQERHHVGDYGFNASIELRTPLLQNFLPGLVREESFIRENPEDVAMHRLQGVVFYDLGWAAFHEPLAGQPDDLTLNSLGVGLRLGVTKHGQFRLDYGFGLSDGPNVDDAGRIHATMQLQY